MAEEGEAASAESSEEESISAAPTPVLLSDSITISNAYQFATFCATTTALEDGATIKIAVTGTDSPILN